jgi:hypothetical protein
MATSTKKKKADQWVNNRQSFWVDELQRRDRQEST